MNKARRLDPQISQEFFVMIRDIKEPRVNCRDNAASFVFIVLLLLIFLDFVKLCGGTADKINRCIISCTENNENQGSPYYNFQQQSSTFLPLVLLVVEMGLWNLAFFHLYF